jgi:plastocyanin
MWVALILMVVGGLGMVSTHAFGLVGSDHHRPFVVGMGGSMDGSGMHGSMDGFGMHGSMDGSGMHGRLGDGGPTIPGAEEVSVKATEFAFEPDLIEVAAGVDFNLTLDNRGTVVHDLVIPEIDLHLAAGPGDSATVGVPGLAPGEYKFFCSVPGHAEAGMGGVLVVSES